MFKTRSFWVVTVIVLVVSAITAQNILLSDFGYETQMESFYNNYLIFKNSYFHLLTNQNLYIQHPEVQMDLFKYSPTFALLFGVFSYLPDFLGLFFWNLLNGLVFYALWQVKFPLVKNKLWVMAFVLVEFITNIQSSQSNGLMVGLMILSYVFLERKNIALATLMIVLSVYLKLFGMVAFAIFLFYPDKWKAIVYSTLWFVVLFLLPLIVVSPTALIEQYQNWLAMLVDDKAVAYSPSVMGWLKSWFGLMPSSSVLTGIGVILFTLPFARIKVYQNPVFKQLVLASVLMWVVLFNHKAESPTFIIAVAGVAIWYFIQERKWGNTILMVLVVIFTQLSPTDLYPSSIRETIFLPYVIKVVPIIMVWAKLTYDLFQLPVPAKT